MAIILYIVRHGQTLDNLENRIQGHTDSPLTELGVRQAEAIANRLSSESFAAIYSSDLGRAVRTAKIIASRHDLSIQTTPLLRELNLGVAQGLTVDEFSSQYPEEYRLWRNDPAVQRPSGGETIESSIERCALFIQQVMDEHKDGDKVAAVVHGGTQRGLVCAAFNLSPKFCVSMSPANASLSIIEIGDRPYLRLFNDTCHLHGIEVTMQDADAGQNARS